MWLQWEEDMWMFMPRGVWYGSLLLAFSVVDVLLPRTLVKHDP